MHGHGPIPKHLSCRRENRNWNATRERKRTTKQKKKKKSGTLIRVWYGRCHVDCVFYRLHEGLLLVQALSCRMRDTKCMTLMATRRRGEKKQWICWHRINAELWLWCNCCVACRLITVIGVICTAPFWPKKNCGPFDQPLTNRVGLLLAAYTFHTHTHNHRATVNVWFEAADGMYIIRWFMIHFLSSQCWFAKQQKII